MGDQAQQGVCAHGKVPTSPLTDGRDGGLVHSGMGYDINRATLTFEPNVAPKVSPVNESCER
jgi:hypothetical protein